MSASNGTPDILSAHTGERRIGINNMEMEIGARIGTHETYET